MKKTTIAIVGLAGALLITNAAWLFVFVEETFSYNYLDESYRDAKATAIQALLLLPEAARPGATKQSILAAAGRGQTGEPFASDGFTWVGNLGLRFNSAGVLVEVRASVDPL